MNDKAFFDSNLILYLYSEDENEKRKTCEWLVTEHFRVISIQVIHEVSNVLSKKFCVKWQDIARVATELLSSFSFVNIEPNNIFRAYQIAEKYRYSYFDSLIISSALESGCTVLFSEDLQHGQLIEGKTKIVNPFKEDILQEKVGRLNG